MKLPITNGDIGKAFEDLESLKEICRKIVARHEIQDLDWKDTVDKLYDMRKLAEDGLRDD